MPDAKQKSLFELANQLDAICDRFEAVWRDGQQPRIEDYLVVVPESERAILLQELLACEVELRMSSGKPADETACCRRFPKYIDVVKAVFSESADHTFFGKLRDYKLQQKLGEGGMGVVYKALHTRLKHSVAIKTLPRETLNQPEKVSRFHREMEAIGKLDDPHIVRAHDAGEVDGTHYLVMEFVDGLNLTQLQERVGPMSVANACEVIRQAALGLQSISDVGLVHRDIKPSNLMLTRSGTVKILDLGLAQVGSKMYPVDRPELTSTGQIMGTFDYLAPEQATDTKNVDIRADIYGLGCTLFKLLTGRAPYAAQKPMTAYQRIRAHLEDPIPSAAANRADVPPELDSLLEKMLAKKAVDRPQTPRKLSAQLAAFCTDHDLPALMASALAESNAEVDTASVSGATIPYVNLTNPHARFSASREAVTELRPDEPVRKVTAAEPTVQGSSRRSRILPTAILLLLAAGVVAYFSGLLTFTVKTDGGTIVLECDPAALEGAKIEVDGQEVQLKLAGDDQPVTIGVDKRRGQLRITKAGFKVFDDKFDIALGENQHAIQVRLIPLVNMAAVSEENNRWQPGPADNVLPGLIPRPASFPGIKRWQIETKLPRTVIHCGTYSPDGRLIACGTNSGHVRIYDAETLELVELLPTATFPIRAVAWSSDGQWLAFGGDEYAVRLWHVTEKRSVQIPVKNTGHAACTSISWAKDSTRFAFASGTTIEICNVTGQRMASLPANHVRAVAWSPDGETLAEGDSDGKVSLWSSNNSTFAAGPVVETKERITCIAWHPNSQQFATGHEPSRIRVYHKDGRIDRIVEVPEESQIYSLTWSPDGNTLVSGGTWMKIHNLDDVSKSLLLSSNATPSTVLWHPEGNRFACVDGGRSISIWRPDGSRLKMEKGHQGAAKQAIWSSDGQFFASTEDAVYRTRVWSVEGKSTAVIAGGFCIEWHPHQNTLIGLGNQWAIQEWDVQGKLLGTLIPSRNFETWSVAWSPDGKQIAVGHDNRGVIEIWEPRGKRVAELKLPEPQRIECLDWKPAGTTLATGGSSAWIWEPAKTHEPVRKLEGSGFCSINWSPDGDRLAASEGYSSIWSLDGIRGPQFEGFRGGDYSVDWNPDGTRLVTGSPDCTVRLWSDEGLPQAVLRDHDSLVWHVDWNSTGSHIVSGAMDCTVIVWDAATNEAVWVGVQLGTGDSATFSAAGEVLDGTPDLVEEHFVYVVENEDGSRELLRPSAFQKRISRSVLTEFAADRWAAEWVLSVGGNVTLINPAGEVVALEDGKLPPGPFFVQVADLQNTATKDADLARLSGLSRIYSLSLADTQVTGEGLKQLAPLKSLRVLSLAVQPGLGDVGFDAINQLENLTFLGLDLTDCTDEQLMRLTRLSKLGGLSVSRNPKLTNRGIEFLLKQNPQLDQLHMHREPNGGTYEPSCIVHAPNLRLLTTNPSQLNGAAMTAVAEHPTLSWLQVYVDTKRDEELVDQLIPLIIRRKELTNVGLAGNTETALTLIKSRVAELRARRPEIELTIDGADYHKVYEAEDSIDRRAAKWALGIGGTVKVLALPDLAQPANTRSITSADQLPTGYFEVIGVELDANQKVDDAGLANLAGLPGIQALSLRNTKVSDAGLQHLASLSSMQTLLLNNTTVSDVGLRHLQGMQKLEVLFLFGTQVTDAGAETLAQLSSLYKLDVSSTRITADGLAKLQGIKNLRELDLAGTKINDADLEILRRFTELKSLNVTDLGVSDATLGHIANLESLEVLIVGGSDRLTDEGLKHLTKLKRLTIVSFAYTNISDGGLEHLPKLPLKHLDVRGTRVFRSRHGRTAGDTTSAGKPGGRPD